MKRKLEKMLATIMCLMTAVAFMPAYAFADGVTAKTGSIKIKCSISKYGKFVEAKDGSKVANKEITVTDKNENGVFDIDDAFIIVHEKYYNGDAAGYETANGEYGLYVLKLWGDNSGHFGYQINQGSVNVLGLNQEIKEGQHLDAYINESAYPNNEAYAAFTKYEQSVTVGKAVNLCLNEAGYDESWNIVMNPCGDATITIDGVATKTKTDTKGNAKITINKIGTHIVSAEKVKEINLTEGEDTVTKQVTAITAPVCTVTVKAPSVGKVSISKVVPGKKQAKVSWKAVKGASGYQVAYKRSGKATKYTTASKSPKTIKKLKKGKKYTFKVRAYVKVGSKKYYGAWSKSITKKIK